MKQPPGKVCRSRCAKNASHTAASWPRPAGAARAGRTTSSSKIRAASVTVASWSSCLEPGGAAGRPAPAEHRGQSTERQAVQAVLGGQRRRRRAEIAPSRVRGRGSAAMLRSSSWQPSTTAGDLTALSPVRRPVMAHAARMTDTERHGTAGAGVVTGPAGRRRGRGQARRRAAGRRRRGGRASARPRCSNGSSGSCAMPAGPGEPCDGLFTPRPLGPLYDLADQLGGELLDLCAREAGTRREVPVRATLAVRRAGGLAAAHRVRPPPDGRDGRALPAPAQRPLGEGAPAVDRPGLPVRGRAGPAGHGRRERAAGGAEHLHRARRGRRGPADPAEAGALGVRSIPVGPRSATRGIRSGSPGANARSSGDLRRAEQRRIAASCSSRPRPSTTTSPPCSPSSARQPQRRPASRQARPIAAAAEPGQVPCGSPGPR